MKRIVVVDNHPMMLRFMENLLTKEGYEVETALSGIAALDVLTQRPADVVFVDLVMPNIGGDRLCSIIRAMPEHDDTLLVVLSGIAAEQEIDFQGFGANACIAKGPLNEMSAIVLGVLDQLQKGDTEGLSTTIGCEKIFVREISKELLSSKRHSEAILHNLAEGILELTTDGRVIFANAAAVSLIGLPEERLLAGDFVKLFHTAHQQRVTELLRRADTGHREASPADAPMLLHGRHVNISALEVDDEEKLTTIVILSDVTEQRRMETQMRRARSMEAVLAGAVAHDLNNILGGIVTYPDLLLMDLDDDSPLREPILSIQRAGRRAVAVVQDLLTLARKGHKVMQIASLNDIVNEYLVSVEHQALLKRHSGVEVVVELDDDVMNLNGSPVHLCTGLMNLVANGAEAIGGQGSVMIKTANCYLDTTIQGFDEIPEGEYVTLSVTDTGVGMTPEEAERVFEPFFTKKILGREGTGLGMAVLWGTVKDQKGYIHIDSDPGRGSTFTLYFPATRAALTPQADSPAPASYTGGGELILIVDDVEEQRNIAAEILGTLGYKVQTVANGEDAVAIVARQAPDLLVLDMIMDPGIDGLETYRRAIDVRPGQRAIIVSGFAETDRVTEMQQLGAGAFLRKPYLIEKFGLAVRGELDRKRS